MTDFERVKGKTDLLAIIEGETGFKLKRSHLEECPFCSGHECFSVDTAKGVYKCFQCDAAGDVFTFFQKYHNIDAHEALKRAAAAVGVTLTEPARREIRLTTRERIFIEAADYYHRQFNENGAKSYLIEKRGHREDVLKAMRVGWTDGGLVDYLKEKGFSEAEIKASGLAKERSAKGGTFLADTFMKHLAIFPHMDGSKVLHFTVKDPEKRIEGRSTPYQLKNEYRHKDWRFYNQGALQRFNEIIVVEGENDTLSVLDAGVLHIIGLIGQPSEQQIKALKAACAKKHVYLWVDNDLAGRGGWSEGKWHEGYIRQICAGLQGVNVRIICHPSGEEGTQEFVKDPDDYLRGFAGDRRKEIKRLQAEAVDYITWEIGEIAKLSGLDNRLKALKDRKIFRALAGMMETEKEIFQEKIGTLGFSKQAIEEQLDIHRELRLQLSVYLDDVGKKKDADPNKIAGIIFEHLNTEGRVMRDAEGEGYCFYHHKLYNIGTNIPFEALIKRITGPGPTTMLSTKEPGRSLFRSLILEAYNAGLRISRSSWLHTDLVNNVLYINLNSANSIILKLSPGVIEEIPNALNPDGIFLKPDPFIKPFNYLPDVDIKEGMSGLKDLIFQNLACEKEQRYFILCWFLCAFFLDYVTSSGMMHFTGGSASGKTSAARLLSFLLYGSQHLGKITGAASYALATQSPLIIFDDQETEERTKNIEEFWKHNATGGGKIKRKEGTSTEVTEERPKNLVILTAIDSFTKEQLINRTYTIRFSKNFHGEGYIESDVIAEILSKRDLIMSAVLKLISSKILPNISKRRDYITILRKEYKGHSKARTDEFLSLAMLILEMIIKYFPYYEEDDPFFGAEDEFGWGDEMIRKSWIEYQNAVAKDTTVSSSSVIKLFDGLVREYLQRLQADKEKEKKASGNKGPSSSYGVFTDESDFEQITITHPEYGLEIMRHPPKIETDERTGDQYLKTVIEFVASSGEIVTVLDRYCKNNGLRNPYPTSAIFGDRLRNERAHLAGGHWELVSKPGIEPYFKKVMGVRFWKFRKTIVR